MTAAALLLGFVTAERIAELYLSRRNTAALLATRALEFAPRHYPAIVLMHVLWLTSLWIFGARQMIDPTWLAIFLSLQVMRVWILITLGPRWTTRIIILPGTPLFRGRAGRDSIGPPWQEAGDLRDALTDGPWNSELIAPAAPLCASRPRGVANFSRLERKARWE